MDLYDPRERRLTYTVPKWITFWRSYTVLERTVSGAVFYNISLGERAWIIPAKLRISRQNLNFSAKI